MDRASSHSGAPSAKACDAWQHLSSASPLPEGPQHKIWVSLNEMGFNEWATAHKPNTTMCNAKCRLEGCKAPPLQTYGYVLSGVIDHASSAIWQSDGWIWVWMTSQEIQTRIHSASSKVCWIFMMDRSIELVQICLQSSRFGAILLVCSS